MKQVKVLIVDDSLLFREMLQQELIRDVNVRVVGKAADAFEAGRMITEHAPDVLIVDIVMDKLNGLDFIRQLLPQYYLPVIVVSSDLNRKKEAESIPTVTFIGKPAERELRQTSTFFDEILSKIRSIVNHEAFYSHNIAKFENRLIAIGASTGGAEAIENVLSKLPSQLPPIVISQHMPAKFTKSFAERLNVSCKLSVKEGEDGEALIPGQVYIAPGSFHMSVVRRVNRYIIRCAPNTSGSPVCPSVDVLFHSVASACGENALGILLTGMGRDGAQGLKKMCLSGAMTVGQDEQSSVIYGMPKAAYDIGAVVRQMSLARIPKQISDWTYLQRDTQ